MFLGVRMEERAPGGYYKYGGVVVSICTGAKKLSSFAVVAVDQAVHFLDDGDRLLTHRPAFRRMPYACTWPTSPVTTHTFAPTEI